MTRTAARAALAAAVVLVLVASPMTAAAEGQTALFIDRVKNTVTDTLSDLLALPFRGLARALTWGGEQGAFKPVGELVFGARDDPEATNVITSSEWEKVVEPWYRRVLYVATLPSVVQAIVTLMGYSAVMATANPRGIVNMNQRFWDIACAAMFVGAAPTLVRILSDLNGALVATITYGLSSQGISLSSLTTGNLIGAVATGNSLLDALIELAFAGLMFQLNLIYLVRKFVVAIIVIIMPVVGWAWAFRGTRTPVLIALSEIATNCLMNFSHALVLGFYLTMLRFDASGVFRTWWARLFGLTLVIPVSALLRRMIAGWLNFLGVDEERWAGLAMAGLGGLGTLGVLAGSIVGTSGSSVSRTYRDYMQSRIPVPVVGGGGGDEDDGGGFTRSSAPASGGGSAPSGGASQTEEPQPGGGFAKSNVTAPGGESASSGESEHGGATSQTGESQSVGVSATAAASSAGAGSGQAEQVTPRLPSEVPVIYREPPKRRQKPWYDWDGLAGSAAALGRLAGTVAGMGVQGHRGHGSQAFGEIGAMLMSAPVSIARKSVDLGTAKATANLDEGRWR